MADLLHTFPGNYGGLVLIIILIICAALASGLLVVHRNARRLNLLLLRIAGPGAKSNLAESLQQMLDEIAFLRARTATLEQHVESLRREQDRCLQHIGFVRYDAFENIGGKTSFSIAVVDAVGTGLAMSAVYNRQDCRVYAKQLERGESQQALSDEELEAVKLAGANQ